ncbi:MAG: UrcA family protein [Blastomonas sp.]
MFPRFPHPAKAALLGIAAISSTIAVAPAAFAGENSNYVTRSIDVLYGDLDLSSDAGAAELEARVSRAARKVCGASSAFTLAEKMDARQCAADAVSSSKKAVVTLLARATTGDRYARDGSIQIGN